MRSLDDAFEILHIKAGKGILGPPEDAQAIASERVKRGVCEECAHKRVVDLSDPIGSAKQFAVEKGADLLADTIVSNSLDIAAPIGPEAKTIPLYDNTAIAVDAFRSGAWGANTIAEKISGLAMGGVN